MGKKKKPFIDKKRSVKFQLVHRGQRDPLQADPDASELVLHPVDEVSKKREEQKKFGVYYDDDYDYLQHLKPRGEGTLLLAEDNTTTGKEKTNFKDVAGISLPSEALASEYEEAEGVLEKGVLPRGPQPHWDPDIVEALDDGLDLEDPENILDDDFIMLAGEEVDEEEKCDYDDYPFPKRDYGDYSHDNEDDGCDSDGFMFGSDDESGSDFEHEETKSRFTNYSMTSSVIRRTEGLRLIDNCFEKVMEEYDDEEIGELDEDDVGGVLNAEHPLVSQMINEVNEQKEKTILTDCKELEQGSGHQNVREEDYEEDDDDKEDEDFEIYEEKEKEEWDCESIVSTYSNLYNHPTTIPIPKKVKPIKLTKKIAIPVDVIKRNEKTEGSDDNWVVESEKRAGVPVFRPKNEDKEDKKMRKKAVKEAKKERRAEKKANKIAFKSEHKIQEKIIAQQPVTSTLKMD
eukprot:gene11325-12511_t